MQLVQQTFHIVSVTGCDNEHADIKSRRLWGVIRFLQAENVRPSEIHRRLVAVYGELVMNVASVRKWCTVFRNGRKDVLDAERSGRPSVITDALKQRWTTLFENINISQLAKCTNDVRNVSYSCVRNCHRTFAIPQNSQAAFWCEKGISKLVSRYDKCLNVQGDYVEK